MECTELKKAMHILKNHLLDDCDYRLGWQANIAMAYYDEAIRRNIGISHDELHSLSNKAAENFIKLLTL